MEACGAFEEKVELVVVISGGKERIFGFESTLYHPDAGSLEVFEAETARSRSGCEAPGVVPAKHLSCSPLSLKRQSLVNRNSRLKQTVAAIIPHQEHFLLQV